jgi:IS4 transposase
LDKEKGEEIVLLTNHLGFGSTTISAAYKDRWQIEIFFKILKQNLRVKTFVGTTANALKIQIWTALIAILLLKYLKVRSRYSWSLSNLVALLRLNLFSYRDLWEWIDKPTEPPPAVQEQEQLALSFT